MIIDKSALEIRSPNSSLVPSLRELWSEAFGDSDEFLDKFFNIAYSENRCRLIAEENRVRAALYWFDVFCNGKKWAYVYAVATAKSHRGKGLCQRLMNSAHELLAEQGYAGAVLVPSEPKLFDFYGRLGYSVCSEICEFELEAGGEACNLVRLGVESYSQKRKELLPENGVLQDGENLDFIASYSAVYLADGLLAVGVKRGEIFECAELLGDVVKAPALLAALGCKKGRFRASAEYAPRNAEKRPFAMAIALDGKSALPAYFGLSFD